MPGLADSIHALSWLLVGRSSSMTATLAIIYLYLTDAPSIHVFRPKVIQAA
jgi:hypothetical protein